MRNFKFPKRVADDTKRSTLLFVCDCGKRYTSSMMFNLHISNEHPERLTPRPSGDTQPPVINRDPSNLTFR